MDFELDGVSAAGARLVELAEKHAAEFALTAERHDRENSFPFENWAGMGRSGFLAASVPAEFGGLGVTSVHDLVVAISRLARGDAASAIGVAMHSVALWFFARLRAAAPAGADESFTAGLKLLLRACARGRVIACVAVSERGGSLGRPLTTAEPTADGYRITGRKAFCTGSPVATLFLTSVRIPAADGLDQLGFALVPRGTAGLSVLPNWDAMGMRGSGSGEVTLDGSPVPARLVVPAGPAGRLATLMFPFTMVGALVLAGAFLGIAEQAQAIVTGAVQGRRRGASGTAAESATVQTIIAENEIELATSRAVVQRVALLLDARLAAGAELERPELNALMREVQCANVAVKRAAIGVVDRALTASGGSGYASSHPLSRLYRDVRAGPFMQPFSALDAHEYIGRVKLGLDTELDG